MMNKKYLLAWLFVISSCGNTSEDSIEDDCFSTAPEDCKSKNCSEILGARYDSVQMCFGAREVVGCEPSNQTRQNTVSYANDADGICWLFPSQTIPQNWVRSGCNNQHLSCEEAKK